MNDVNLKTGTAVGTLLSMVFTVNAGSIMDTIILAAIGASVSFAVSLVWKHCFKKDQDQ